MIPGQAFFNIVVSEPVPEDSQDSQLRSRFESIIEGLLYIFDIESNPQAVDVILKDEVNQVLDTFDK